jgi:hypothetical protein
MKLKTRATFFFLCALFVTAFTAQAQISEFQFVTPSPGFGGELFFNVPSGSTSAGDFLEGNSFITTPDGTFTVSGSTVGGPIFGSTPPSVWSPGGITALNLSLYESIDTKLYYWTATPTSIADLPVGAIPEIPDPTASGTWDYISPVPEPGAMLLTALGVAALLVWPIRHNTNSKNRIMD